MNSLIQNIPAVGESTPYGETIIAVVPNAHARSIAWIHTKDRDYLWLGQEQIDSMPEALRQIRTPDGKSVFCADAHWYCGRDAIIAICARPQIFTDETCHAAVQYAQCLAWASQPVAEAWQWLQDHPMALVNAKAQRWTANKRQIERN